MSAEGRSLDSSSGGPRPNPSSTSYEELKALIDDDVFHGLQKRFLMQGKGRRPDLPIVPSVTNRLLTQLFILKDIAKGTGRELKSWLVELHPHTTHASESRILHQAAAIVKRCLNMPPEEVPAFLGDEFDFCALPPPLKSLGLERCHLLNLKDFTGVEACSISNSVVIQLENFKSVEQQPQVFTLKWLRLLKEEFSDVSDSLLKSSVQTVMKKYKSLSRDAKRKGHVLNSFLVAPFSVTIKPVSSNEDEPQTKCVDCISSSNLVKEKDEKIKVLQKQSLFNERLASEKQHQLAIKLSALEDLQKENSLLRDEVKEFKSKFSECRKENVIIQETNTSLKSQAAENEKKLFYRRNIEANKSIQCLRQEKAELEKKCEELQQKNRDLTQKLKSEMTMKSNYKKKIAVHKDELERSMHALETLETERTVHLKEKCNIYADNVRQLYMTLQGEANVVPAQATKIVQLVAKHLFQTEISASDLPCEKTCLNFMDEAHHIAKQDVVEKVQASNHFTMASDGTSRQKKHYMEHHFVLDNGYTLSVGFTEVPDDKSETLLQKSIDLIDELSDVHCDANDSISKDKIFSDILGKMMCLMSDRASNMKLFNKKMLEFKQNLLGSDASIEFLHCNAHFLIALADAATGKAIKSVENDLGEKLGRDREKTFSRFSSNDESASFRLIRLAAEVLGPRGDEKNGCRQDWLAHCDSLGLKSIFSSYRSNRFNNLFENAVAVLAHREAALHFLESRLSHSNLKLQSIVCDLKDEKLLSIITGIALFSTYVASPYWSLMNSTVPYGQFPKYVRSMNEALGKWSSSDFPIENIFVEKPVFGEEFEYKSDVAKEFFQSTKCDKNLAAQTFRLICAGSTEVLQRQLADFLPSGVYGGTLSKDLQTLLDTCPLTNLAGERMFGDLDFDMVKRRTASTFLRTTVNMWKHNTPSKFLESKSPQDRKQIMVRARKCGKRLKLKHKSSVKLVRESIKRKLEANEQAKKQKDIKNKERQAALLTDILNQGGLCETIEDLNRLMSGPKALQNLKAQMRFRKFYMNASDLRLSGNLKTLFQSLCSHLGLEHDSGDETDFLPKKKRGRYRESEVEEPTDDEDDSHSDLEL